MGCPVEKGRQESKDELPNTSDSDPRSNPHPPFVFDEILVINKLQELSQWARQANQIYTDDSKSVLLRFEEADLVSANIRSSNDFLRGYIQSAVDTLKLEVHLRIRTRLEALLKILNILTYARHLNQLIQTHNQTLSTFGQLAGLDASELHITA